MNVRRRRAAPWETVLGALAVAAFAPLLWSSPGRVSADTKTYLYLNPGRFLAKAPWLWDRSTGLGTVSHQTIGYLFPMGPWYWLTSAVGLPDWLAQRLWLGLVFFAAGSGVVALARQLRLPWRAAAVAAFAYQLSPYVLSYAARLSVILLPWAGLGWLMTFTHRALQERSWRWPAAVALVVLTVGGVNATALVLVALGPLCLVAWTLWSDRTLGGRRAFGAVTRIGLLSLSVSVWWLSGLWAQGRFGLPVLRYTETYEAVARAASPIEVLRGLGYWFGYGGDAVSSWVEPVGPYTHSPVLIMVSLSVPALGLAALALTRWRARGLAVLLVVVGVVVSVGAHPYDDPSVVGRGLRAVIRSTLGQALRSTPRAVPLVALGLGLGLGMGVEILVSRRPRLRWAAPLGAVGLVAASLPSLWVGHIYTASLLRNERVPAWWTDVAAALDRGDPGMRVLEIPGSDFASYRWGGTVDPVLAGLTTRDVAARELVPWGSAASADLLAALDRRWQERLVEPDAVAPLLRRLGVADVVLRGDLAYERYGLVRPRTLAAALAATPGLGAPRPFGPLAPPAPTGAAVPATDAEELITAASVVDPAPASIYSVQDPRAVVRAEPDHRTIVAGDGDGLVDLAAVGGLERAGVILYAGALAGSPQGLAGALAGGADVVVTDTNRRQARSWGSLRQDQGATETATEVPLRADPADNRLDLFPGAGVASYTVAELQAVAPAPEVARVRATGYGNPVTSRYTPEDRPAMAVDGDARTAWRVGAFAEVRGERLEIQLAEPTTTDAVTLLQPSDGAANRWITGVRLRFDGASALDVRLDDSSRAAPGQRLATGPHTFTTLSVEITDTNFTPLPAYGGISAVGFAEVDVAGARAAEHVRLPSDVLGQTTDQNLTLLLTRQRASALDADRSDPEPSLRRAFALPVGRTFAVTGTGALSPRAGDETLAALLTPTGVRAVASARLAGDPTGTGAAAIDGSPATAWQTPVDAPFQHVRISAPDAVTVDRLVLQVLADGRHSVPVRLRVTADDGSFAIVDVPPVVDGARRDARATDPLVLRQPLTGRVFDVAIEAVREVRSTDAATGRSVVQPVGIAELGLPGLTAAPLGTNAGSCRDDLVRIDGAPVAVRVVRADATVTVAACGDVRLGPGEHRLETAAGRDTGLDLDRLVLRSASTAPVPVPVRAGRPTLDVARTSRTSYRVAVSRAAQPFWLVLGQSVNPGWHAVAAGRDLGRATLVDGYANGWLVQPGSAELTVTLRWTPQAQVWRALVVSALAAAACVALVAVGWRTERTTRRRPAAGAPDAGPTAAVVGPPRSLPVVSVLAALGALVCSGWTAALLVVLVRIAIRFAPVRMRRASHAAPALLVGIAAAYVVLKQARYHLPSDFRWPAAFETVQPLAWASVFLVVPTYRRRGGPAARPTGTDGPVAVPAESAPIGGGLVAGEPVAAAGAGTGAGDRQRSWPPGLRDRDEPNVGPD